MPAAVVRSGMLNETDFNTAQKNPVVGIYKMSQQAEVAVDKLIQAGFQGGDVSALHPDNQSSREFASKKHTRAPRGTVEGESATAPLEGTLGLLNPAQGTNSRRTPRRPY